MLIPAEQFDVTVLDVQGVDMSSEFIKNCGSNQFHIKYVYARVVIVAAAATQISSSSSSSSL